MSINFQNGGGVGFPTPHFKIKPNLTSIEFDNHLIFQLLNGNRSAFDKLYLKYSRNYALICQRYARNKDDAEDYLQDALITIFQKIEMYDSSKANFKTWSSRVVINTCLQKLRKKKEVETLDNFIENSKLIDHKEEKANNYSLEQLTKLIQNLPKGYRSVFNLYVIDGYTHKEISDILGISVGTSKSQLLRAKKILQGKINSMGQKAISNYG